MSESTRGLDRRTFLTGAAALGAAVLLKPALAFAEPTAADKLAEADAVRARIVDMQAQLDVVTEQYYKALDEHAAAQQAVADAQARIDEATAPVSYTHLDVYKRQGLNHAALFMMVGNSSGKQLRNRRCAPSV